MNLKTICLLITLVILSFNSFFAQKFINPPLFAQKVFDDIYSVMSDKNTVKPKLIYSKNSNEIAQFNARGGERGEPIIIIGEKFIEIARSFGPDSCNALAHVLGHEFAHVVLHQNHFSDVGTGYASDSLNQIYKNLEFSLRESVYERQADEYAAFYSTVAGYNTENIGGKLLDSIYKKFELSDSLLSQYPKLSERKQIVMESYEQMSVLKTVFDDALLSLMTGKYEMAGVFLNTIIREKYTSSEIYNNLGLSYLLDVIDDVDTLEFPYFFPVQIDFNTNLKTEKERGFSVNDELKLKDAIECFDKAIGNSKNNNYKAYLNKAIAEFLLGNYDAMESSLDETNKSNDPDVLMLSSILIQIYNHKLGRQKDALKVLLKLKDSSIVASRNCEKWDASIKETKSKFILENNFYYQELISDVPKMNFDSQNAVNMGDEKLSRFSNCQEDFLYKIVSSDSIYGRRWKYKPASTKPTITVYEFKTPIDYRMTDWEELYEFCDNQYKFENREYVVLNDIVLMKNGLEIKMFKID